MFGRRSTLVRPEAAPSILTLLSADNAAKYIELSKYAANGSLIAVGQQILENQRTEAANQARIIQALSSMAKLVSELVGSSDEIQVRLGAIVLDLSAIEINVRSLLPGKARYIFFEEFDMSFTIGADDAPKRLRLKITDKHGNPAKVDGVPQWATSNAETLNVTQDENGMAGSVSAVGPVGTAQLTVTADADLGAGVEQITGTADFEVVAGKASAIDFEPEV